MVQVAETKRKFPRFAAAAIEDVETSTLPWQTSSVAAQVQQSVEQLPEAGPSRSICADLQPPNGKHSTFEFCRHRLYPWLCVACQTYMAVPAHHIHTEWRMHVLCCAVLCCAVLCCAVLCCAALCCAVLRCAALCCAVLRCAVLCCAVLCCDTGHVLQCPVYLVCS